VCRASESDEEASSEVVDKIRGGEDSKEEDRTSMGESKFAEKIRTFLDLASNLVNEWTSLKAVFRISKKERIEQMEETEREAGGFICIQREHYLILYRGHRKTSHESLSFMLFCFTFHGTYFPFNSFIHSVYRNVSDDSITICTSDKCFVQIGMHRGESLEHWCFPHLC
jgi:hypothetical protein